MWFLIPLLFSEYWIATTGIGAMLAAGAGVIGYTVAKRNQGDNLPEEPQEHLEQNPK